MRDERVEFSLFEDWMAWCAQTHGDIKGQDVERRRKNLPGGESAVVPPDPMPNSEVKRRSADGSVGSPHARVGNCQASNCGVSKTPVIGLTPLITYRIGGAVVQSVRIPACHAGGRGFESRPHRQLIEALGISSGFFAFINLSLRQRERHSFLSAVLS